MCRTSFFTLHFHTFRRLIHFFVSLLIAFWVSSCGGYEKPTDLLEAEAQLPEKVDFNLHVKPILSDKCFACHGPDEASQEAGLELATPGGAFAALKDNPGEYAIVAGKPGKSEVYHRIVSEDPEYLMPPPESNLTLTAYEKAVLTRWIEEGAEYKPHWAFIKPEKHDLPKVKNQEWVRNPIDHFVLAKLEQKGLQPSEEADKETLLRRLSLDLTGLPPSLEEIDAFLADQSEYAYEKVVDRLLASPHYGERIAIDWMDASRYADTHGYTVDRYRPMWPWRDWVIGAYNENMPFDQFATWQLAGDLLPNATREQKLATAYNRNHAQNMEGGIVNEEFRVEYVADRTNTLGTNFLGLTVECARCHDHKYDPISQKEYFQLFGFFNQVDEAGQISWDDAMPVPTLLLTDEKEDSLLAFIDQKIAETEKDIERIKEEKKTEFEQAHQANSFKIDKSVSTALQAHFTLDQAKQDKFLSTVSSKHQGSLAEAILVEGKLGKAVKLNGDEALDLGEVGVFSRANPFTISLWVNIPEKLKEGVIFHKGNGAILYNFRGYHLTLRDNRFELLMAHTWPYNNIIKLSEASPPKEEWVHLAVTYDGSSQAEGLKLYVNGEEQNMQTNKDNLYKDILFPFMDKQPGLQIGARWRGVGFKNGLVDEIRVYERELGSPEIASLAGTTKLASESTSLADEKSYFDYYLYHQVPAYQAHLKKLEKLREERNSLVEDIEEMMVMDELDEPRPTFVLERGAYDAHGESVEPGTPAQILSFPDSLKRDRLGLAKWLFHKDHPLTARVMVNRFWQHYFGKGLVSTSADFGNQGNLPSHPMLLDWLALQFQASGWDIKAMQKLIVMSATYRQSSFATEEQQQNDPDNLFLARGPVTRLSAEVLRDHALASSGVLVKKIGGPSVKPYQPEGLWAFNGATYEQDEGEKLFRRSLYTFWKRTVPPPSMNTFDAPDRSYCVVDRQQTSTPLQALILLNDPQFVEASRHIAYKVITQEEKEEERINMAFRLLTGRTAKDIEMKVLVNLLENEQRNFAQKPEKAEGWLSSGESQFTETLDPQLLASYTVVTSTIMNSDAFITKR
ncbi:DUF1553 domain-containing protein [Catalinimonas niigatensis]|uniref:DUF1553 domain-containing protein n=1 Tax=Catalinimonas niigatensis TaxID=1397264 RepID=UPI0026653C0D|nr:DUF1553 domain-containing protein [Catalinimonas niigatensis]WPP51175.1 DUF1553 domain-containing protein [Catalinimonas niigatensis]